MEITPQDLGERWRIPLLQRRALARVRRSAGYVNAHSDPADAASAGPDTRRRFPLRGRRLRRFWLRGANLPAGDAARIAPLLENERFRSMLRYRFQGSGAFFTAVFAIALIATASPDSNEKAAAIFGSAAVFWFLQALVPLLFLPRLALKRINTDAVTREEIEALLPTVRGGLDRTYLNTVLETLRQPMPSSSAADLRVALRAIGDTVSQLPGEPMPIGSDDVTALRQAAEEKRHNADNEPDSLIRDSLQRQAEAEMKQALIIEQSHGAARRMRARQEEAVTQLNLIRSVLSVYASPETAAGMKQSSLLADSVRRVAGEAAAATQAKRELDEIELTSLYGAPLPETQLSAVSVGKGTVAPSSQAPAVSGKWWRNGNGSAS